MIIMDAHDRGMIKRIYIENFVTYDMALVKPGRSLNLLIGPNGTGKSTVVCAIVIGLCGRPKLVGRGSSLKDYIKDGYETAKVEIELQDTGNKNIIITRSFNKQNQSNWLLNGKTAHINDIKEVIKDLNIQVDNLCQFLPQDKVQSFSEMNAQELLENTERSVGDPKLLEYHNQLKDLRKKGREFETMMLNKSRLLETETQKYEGLKMTVGNIKESKAVQKKIKTFQQKKAWMQYDLSRKQLTEAKVNRNKAAAAMKKLDEQLKPINKKIADLEKTISVLKRNLESYNTKLSSKISAAKTLVENVNASEHEIRRIEKNHEHKIKAEQNRDQEINSAMQLKNKLVNDLKKTVSDGGTEETLNATCRQLGQEIEQKRNVVEKRLAQLNASKSQDEMINHQIRGCMTEMQAAKDVDAKRLELLRRFSKDAYEGVMWLRQNREKFNAPVHEPMLLNIHVKDARYSKYLENLFALRDLLAFVCEDKADMNRLMGLLRDQKGLTINVVHSDPQKHVKTVPNVPMDNIRQYGFQHYLLSLIEAPPTIMKYLISMYNITNIPLGTRDVEDNIEQIPLTIRHFFSQENYYAVNVSKYTGARSTRISRVSGNSSLSIILDTEKVRSLDSRLAELNARKERVVEDIKAEEINVKKANDELDKIRAARQTAQRHCQIIMALNSKITIAEKKIRDLQNERTNIEDIQSAATRDIQKTLNLQLQYYAKYNTQLEDCLKHMVENAQKRFELESTARLFVMQTNVSQNLRDQFALAERTFERLEHELMTLRTATQRLWDAAMDTTDNIEPTDPRFKKLQQAFAKLPFTIDEIDTELDKANAKAYCLGKNADGEAILRNFENMQANVQRLTEEIEQMTIDRTTVTEQIEELRPMWITPLQELVDRINRNFSTYFGLMNCAGEVILQEGETPNDFDQYGLKIRVKFRDADELQELTRQRQSGGERAVTTAVYMISLQELSRVPFRCVDEINQGMDANNERRVFELIVQITERDNSSQYFLVTPKLLPDLEYGEHCTVHIIFNGQYMVSHEEHDTEEYIKKLERRRSGSGDT